MKTVDFSDIITVCDLKLYRCRQLIELMKIVYCRSMSFLYLCQKSFKYMRIKTGFSQKLLSHFESNFVCKLSETWKSNSTEIILVT